MIGMYWPSCKFINGKWGNEAIDSFWVECSKREIQEKMLPSMPEKQQLKLEQNLKRCSDERPNMYFLVSKDLQSIYSMPWYYPHSGHWGAYCPFVNIQKIVVDNLYEIKTIIPRLVAINNGEKE